LAGDSSDAPSWSAPRFRVLHWAKAPAAPGTLWAELGEEAPAPLGAAQRAALERLFAVQRKAASRRASGAFPATQPAVAHFVPAICE